MLGRSVHPSSSYSSQELWCDLLCHMTPESQLWWGKTCLQTRAPAEFTKSPGCKRHEVGTAAASSFAQFERVDKNFDTFPHYLLAAWRWLCILCCLRTAFLFSLAALVTRHMHKQPCANALPAGKEEQCPGLHHSSPTAPRQPRIYSWSQQYWSVCFQWSICLRAVIYQCLN